MVDTYRNSNCSLDLSYLDAAHSFTANSIMGTYLKRLGLISFLSNLVDIIISDPLVVAPSLVGSPSFSVSVAQHFALPHQLDTAIIIG